VITVNKRSRQYGFSVKHETLTFKNEKELNSFLKTEGLSEREIKALVGSGSYLKTDSHNTDNIVFKSYFIS
jgi:hypothetical protein